MKAIKIFILIGVSGSGKSFIGQQLSKSLDIDFFDGDDFHPLTNVNKMSKGYALTDDDRLPWLNSINNHMLARTSSTIYACSALKEKYRTWLSNGIRNVNFIYLKGSFELIHNRMKSRKSHFMPVDLLQSQFDTLEEPSDAIIIDICLTPEKIISYIKHELNLK